MQETRVRLDLDRVTFEVDEERGRGVEEVIFALASPAPPAQLVLLRLDGTGAIASLEALLATKTLALKSRVPTVVDLIWKLDAPPAPVVAICWKKGASWTGNEGVELLLPGSAPVVDGIFVRLEEAGARPAQPGEFTRRAFVNNFLNRWIFGNLRIHFKTKKKYTIKHPESKIKNREIMIYIYIAK